MNRERKQIYTVKEVCRMTHVTRKTLFYYDRHDLLKPAALIGPAHYKVYSEKELLLLQKIRRLQEAGLKLREIHAFLYEAGVDRKQILETVETRLEEEQEDTELKLRILRDLMAEMKV